MPITIDGIVTFGPDVVIPTDVEINAGFLRMFDSSIGGDLIITDGSVDLHNVRVGGEIILAPDTGNSVRGNGVTVSGGLTLTGGASFQDVVLDGLVMPTGRLIAVGPFAEFSIRDVVIGQPGSSTVYSAGGLIDLTDLTSFDLQATIWRAYRSALRLEDCVGGKVDIIATNPGAQADNTHDALNLVGVCGPLALFGAVYSAAGVNNPRYAIAAAAGTLAPVDVFMSMAGYQTGAINDLSGGSVVLH